MLSYKNHTSLCFRLRTASLTFLSALALAIPLGAQNPLEVKGKGSDIIVFPNGTASFADRVVSFQPGNPAPAEAHRRPEGALGIPDYKANDFNSYVSLGKGGVLILEFVDNRLVDIPGNDLYVFEIGPDIENTLVEISEDGINWIDVGKIQGSTAYIDIGPNTRPGQQFRFVKLTDDPNQGGHSGATPGADIDAIGAIGSIAAPPSPPVPPPTPPSPPTLPDPPPNAAPSNESGSLTYFNAVSYYNPGAPTVKLSNTYPQRILGAPDAHTRGGGSMELGDSGSVILLLTDHLALSGEGHDLVVFGDLKGPLRVEVSANGLEWTTVGVAEAGRGQIEFGDISGIRYVRLTDQTDGLGGSTIDAVGAARVLLLR